MFEILCDEKKYKITEIYNYFRRIWVEGQDNDTKKLILDYTILWNMTERQIYKKNYDKNKDRMTEKCISKIFEQNDYKNKISNIWNLFTDYISKYNSVEEFYLSFKFKKSRIDFKTINYLYNSENFSDKLKLLILSCYRVRCNLFHGPKDICCLNNQKLLFLSMNELLSLMLNAYGI